MLMELYDALGAERIERSLSNIEVKKTLLFILDDNGFKCVSVDKEVNMEDLAEINYLKERNFYIQYINSNKSVVVKSEYKTKKMVKTANKFALSVNISTFNKKYVEGQTSTKKNAIRFETKEELFVSMVEDYCSALLAFTEDTSKEREIYLKYKGEILQELNKEKNASKVLVILIKADVDMYQEEFYKYFSKKIFDDRACQTFFSEDGEEVGFYSTFVTVGEKKPLLKQQGALCEVPQLYTYNEALRLHKLKYYMDKNFSINNKIRIGDNSNAITVEYSLSDSGRTISNFDQNPYIYDSLKDKLSILVEPTVNQYFKEVRIDSYGQLIKILDRYAFFALSSLDKVDSRKKKVFYSYGEAIKDKYDSNGTMIYVPDIDFIKMHINGILEEIKVLNDVTKALNKDGLYRMADILNLSIYVKDYFDKDGGYRVSTFKDVKEKFTKKIVNIKEAVTFGDINEVMFAAGQLAFYLNKKSKGRQVARLISHYHGVKTFERLMTLLKNDMKKYDYAIMMDGREIKIFSLIKEYFVDSQITTLSKDNLDWFELGLYGENCFFSKSDKCCTKNNIVMV